MGKIFTTGHKKGVAIHAYVTDYDGQKAIGRFTPQQISEWLGPEPVVQFPTVLSKEASPQAVANKFVFPARTKRKAKVHWV